MDYMIKSFKVAIWFMFLTFPIIVIKVNTIENIVIWRWHNMFYMGIGIFFISMIWRYLLERKEMSGKKEKTDKKTLTETVMENPTILKSVSAGILAVLCVLPFITDSYQVNILTVALMYIVLGLGLNIVVGLAGLLDLGFVAFYAVGAYAYALLNHHFGMPFWVVLPIGGILAAIFGILLGFPVLRLRGDYLAIVTLGFGEIIRLVLENWNDFFNGAVRYSKHRKTNSVRDGFDSASINSLHIFPDGDIYRCNDILCK